MKRSQVKGFEKRRRQIEIEELEKQRRTEDMQRAVNLDQLSAMKMQQEAQQRANMYTFAANIVVANSSQSIGDGTKLAYQTLVRQSLELAQEYFKQVSELDVKLQKQLVDKQSGVENGSGKIITG